MTVNVTDAGAPAPDGADTVSHTSHDDVVGLVGEPHADVADALLTLVDSERQRTRWPVETVLRHAFGEVLLRLLGRPRVFEEEARDIRASVKGRHPSQIVGTVGA